MKKSNAKAILAGSILSILIFSSIFASSPFIYIADTGNNRIQVFDKYANYITQWGRYGRAENEMNSPSGIAVASAVYVADTGNNRVLKFSLDGVPLAVWGSYTGGTGPGMFRSPSSVAVSYEDCAEYVYVADTGNNRIQKFTSDGGFIAAWGGLSAGTAPGMFNNPQGISAHRSGKYVLVADTGNNRIQKFDASGNFLSAFGSAGSSDG
ncbi:MAG TPA: hypothetical protein P5511_03885, partial [Candidatus Goldiibacteriota bacterium]|nr:hypothetical protein [Candidatus Goldiibacteriota bacterium]